MEAFQRTYKDNPCRFAVDILGLEPDDNQRTILEGIRDNDYLAIGSGRGIGKTIVDGIAAGWVLATRRGAKVLMLANTDAQSRGVLWPPLISMLKASAIAEWFEYTTEMVSFKGEPEFAYIKRVTWSEHSVESVSGYHSRNMLYILDEASKMPNILIENLYASCTERWNKMLLTSNPTRNSGYFYETASNPLWKYLPIDSRSSRWTDKGKISELVERYGEDSDVVRVQVRGLFPRFSSMSIVSEALVSASMTGLAKHPISDVVSIGLDIGAGGDATCWAIRKGLELVEIRKEYTADDGPIMEITRQLVTQHKANYLIYDKSGIGVFLGPRFRAALPSTCDVIGRIFGDAAPEQDCHNMRAWLYRRMGDWFALGGVIGRRPGLAQEILATEYILTEMGKRKLIAKDQIREAIGHSPDEADALALSCGYSGDLANRPALPGATQSDEIARKLSQAAGWMPTQGAW